MSNTVLLKIDLVQLLGLGFLAQAHKHNPKSEEKE